ncbi:hypothetical protein GCM10009836_65350 [Pseudonocardia ailaonensis]|uniref:DUF559 domain-containing protein n=1 Tax=Pseudonocardia ailaonensis TaxID=367279 RepID=A0ABN2NNP6_9PSEU
MLDAPFRGSDAVASGLLTPGALRGHRFVRVFPDVYVPADLPLTFEVRSRAGHVLTERRGGVLAGYSAAVLLGASCEPRGAPAEVIVPSHVRRVPGLLSRQGDVDPAERVAIGSVPVTSRFRTAWDLARRLPLLDAVVAVDALARPARPGRPPRFDPLDLLDRRTSSPGARGCRRLDEVVVLADPRAESPPETLMRLALVFAGLRPRVQHELLDARGDVVARFDLAFPEVLLAVEYDGEDHDDTLDRARDLRTGAFGWHTMRFRGADVLSRPDRMVALVEAQILHRRGLPDVERASRAAAASW